MKFKEIYIKNYRNYKSATVALDNKNLFYGLNDIGKTNFLHAIQVLLDKRTRKEGLVKTDYYKLKTEESIEIRLKIQIGNDEDSDKLRAKLKGALRSEDNIVYIRLVSTYSEQAGESEIELEWGGDIARLETIGGTPYKCDMDDVFEVTYVDSYAHLEEYFKKWGKPLLKSDGEGDDEIRSRINKYKDEINKCITDLSGVKKLQEALSKSYGLFGEKTTAISLQSGLDFSQEFAGIAPFIRGNDDKLYPTSGDGRKKILAYSLYDVQAEDIKNRKISILLVEEPENHLHKSYQIKLSKILFGDSMRYPYLFVTTHSPYIVYEIDKVNIVRIHRDGEAFAKSCLYAIPDEYTKFKRCLNEKLAEAIFAERVMLVEGPSELLLFSRVLKNKFPNFDIAGMYILPVDGIAFEHYRGVLQKLAITCFVRTDNDVFKKRDGTYYCAGLGRCIRLAEGEITATVDNVQFVPQDDTSTSKQKVLDNNKDLVQELETSCRIYLANNDLENDIYEAIRNRINEIFNDVTSDPVHYLQGKKRYRMVELLDELNDQDLNDIYNHNFFKILRDFCYEA